MGAQESKSTPSGEVTNVSKPEDYKPYDFLDSSGAQRSLQAIRDSAGLFDYNPAWYSDYQGAAMQTASQQAANNVRGVGNVFGALGAANSGAAQAAAAEGAMQPFYSAQTDIGKTIGGAQQAAASQKANAISQAIQGVYGQYAGVTAPTYSPTGSSVTRTEGSK